MWCISFIGSCWCAGQVDENEGYRFLCQAMWIELLSVAKLCDHKTINDSSSTKLEQSPRSIAMSYLFPHLEVLSSMQFWSTLYTHLNLEKQKKDKQVAMAHPSQKSTRGPSCIVVCDVTIFIFNSIKIILVYFFGFCLLFKTWNIIIYSFLVKLNKPFFCCSIKLL